jgi:hypothetical protein
LQHPSLHIPHKKNIESERRIAKIERPRLRKTIRMSKLSTLQPDMFTTSIGKNKHEEGIDDKSLPEFKDRLIDKFMTRIKRRKESR